MKYFFFLLSSFFACTNSPKPAGDTTHQLTFKFSEKPSVIDMKDPANWCMAQFGESVLINADPKNYYHRLITLNEIPTKLAVDFGHMAAAFMLCKVGDHVEIYTSDNLPGCLSNKKNFQISPDGSSFRYDNLKEINFDVYFHELPTGVQIEIDLPANGGLGIAGVRCPNCK